MFDIVITGRGGSGGVTATSAISARLRLRRWRFEGISYVKSDEASRDMLMC